ncbi:MAG: hypothetical protein KF729_05850 [Sandaracinaceae bacterium]|nr:hypothetical protein [Sandaracinaceae bacterium]
MWRKVGLPLDRATFVRELDEVRQIRNDVMHFDPDGLSDEQRRRLKELGELMRRVVHDRR